MCNERNEVLAEYQKRYAEIKKISEKLYEDLNDNFKSLSCIDRISVRPKSIDRFYMKSLKKKEDNSYRYADPLNQIQDQIGARIIVRYLDDVELVSEQTKKYYRFVEEKLISPESLKEFGYEGMHYILLIPNECKVTKTSFPLTFFELQIKTLFQHAWSEAEHDLNYKTSNDLVVEEKKTLYFAAAQAWGADRIFNDIYKKNKNH